jgi:hypothetical protein
MRLSGTFGIASVFVVKDEATRMIFDERITTPIAEGRAWRFAWARYVRILALPDRIARVTARITGARRTDTFGPDPFSSETPFIDSAWPRH